MNLYGQLHPGGDFTLRDGREGPLIASGVFTEGYPAEARAPLMRQLLQGPAALAALQAVRTDLELVLAEAVRVAGGGVTGLAAAEAQYAPLFQHKERIESVLKNAGLG